MQHHPDAVRFVKANLDEVVATAKRAQVNDRVCALHLWVLLLQRVKPVLQTRSAEHVGHPLRHVTGEPATSLSAAVGHSVLYDRADMRQAVRSRSERQLLWG